MPDLQEKRKTLRHLNWLILFASLLISSLFFSVWVMNSDYKGRGESTNKVITNSKNAIGTLFIILERAADKSNSVATRVIFEPNANNETNYEKEKCIRIFLSNRDPIGYPRKKEVGQGCRNNLGWNSEGLAEINNSSPIEVSTYTSLEFYPFDSMEILPLLTIKNDNGSIENYDLVVIKRFPGRVLKVEGNDLNFKLFLKRPFSEIFTIMTLLVIYIALNIAGTLIILNINNRFSSIQDIIAIASYFIASISFKALIASPSEVGFGAIDLIFICVPVLCALTVIGNLILKKTCQV